MNGNMSYPPFVKQNPSQWLLLGLYGLARYANVFLHAPDAR